jgi:Ser/Thr protein kinase RdoA (MazF antagonist)
MSDLPLKGFTTLSIMLKELYGFSTIDNFKSLSGGFTTENFSFSCTNNHYFLKRYNTTSTERIHDINVALERFAEGEIPVITPVHDKQGEPAFFFDDAWWGVFPFVDGRTYSSNELTTKHATQLGSMLGKLHKIGLSCNKGDVQPITLWNKNVLTSDKLALEYVYQHEANKRDVDTTAIQNLRLQERFILNNPHSVAELRPENNCLIHGDFTHNNVFFTQDGRVQSVYDLDKTCIAPRGYEVARSTLITCFDHGWDEKSFKLSDSFLRAYLSVCPMSFEEFAHGFNIYVTHFMHMTWLEKKVILYKSKRHEPFVYSSHERLKHLLSDYSTLAKRLYPNIK